MSKTVWLGDSISSITEFPETISSIAGYEACKKMAVAGGSNTIQLWRLDSYLCTEEYSKDDVFVFGLSGFTRSQTNLGCDFDHNRDYETIKRCIYEHHLPWNPKTLKILLCHATDDADRVRMQHDKANLQAQPEIVLQQVLSYCKMLSWQHRVIVFRGWADVISTATTEHNQYMQHLAKYVTVIDEPVLEWCREHYPEFIFDNYHPSYDASMAWAYENILDALIDART